MNKKEQMNRILAELTQHLDIPEGYYEKAVGRYKSMSDYFHRSGSLIAHLDPAVYPQGSFRLGTVIRPLLPDEGYDLDLVCRIKGFNLRQSQKTVKELVGVEVKSYSQAQNFRKEPEEGKRCWTQQYQDEVDFHMDVLPSIPNESSVHVILERAGVSSELAREALAITDLTHPNYSTISSDWPRSNPKGYAIWFDERMDIGGYAKAARQIIFERQSQMIYASVDEVPAYRIKTPLQRVVQILKRHRDQMFRNDPKGKPISIIITTLAARAYRGETEIAHALTGILAKMESYVSQSKPRIENPVDPEEDFTDRWDQTLEDNFWRWLRQAKNDFAALDGALSSKVSLERQLSESFGLSLPSDVLTEITNIYPGAPTILPSQDTKVTRVSKEAARPWARK